eukprot:9350334-Alexandrium_andersonii.AAC.1
MSGAEGETQDITPHTEPPVCLSSTACTHHQQPDIRADAHALAPNTVSTHEATMVTPPRRSLARFMLHYAPHLHQGAPHPRRGQQRQPHRWKGGSPICRRQAGSGVRSTSAPRPFAAPWAAAVPRTPSTPRRGVATGRVR